MSAWDGTLGRTGEEAGSLCRVVQKLLDVLRPEYSETLALFHATDVFGQCHNVEAEERVREMTDHVLGDNASEAGSTVRKRESMDL
ncbi:hypothetical protein K523DRAFT_356781 [Schizophyllum commune Tattone D]|nr:hypothetical protein K523DRAFT_356781 [Schizophyllum commune Tattone D]